MHAGCAHRSDDFEPIDIGQHPIERNRVIAGMQCFRQALAPARDPFDIDAVAIEFGDDLSRRNLVVFDGQNLRHEPMLTENFCRWWPLAYGQGS